MYLSFFLPPFPPPLRPFSYFIFLYLFSMCLCLTLSGFPANGSLSACNGSPNCHALLFPLYSLGRHSAKSSISPTVTTLFPLFPFLFFFFFSLLQAAKLNYVRFENFALCLFYPCLFPVKTDCRLVQHVFLSCASAFVDSKFLVIVCNNVLYARLVFALRYGRQALHLLVLYCWPFASGSTYINIAPVAGPIGGGSIPMDSSIPGCSSNWSWWLSCCIDVCYCYRDVFGRDVFGSTGLGLGFELDQF